jgi:hypothetical protein
VVEAEASYRAALAAEADHALAHNGLATLLWNWQPVRPLPQPANHLTALTALSPQLATISPLSFGW